MPIQFNEVDNGKILAIHARGTLVKADYHLFVPEFDRLLREHGKLRVQFDLTGFHGWEPGAVWDEIKFDVRHFADIERIAVVGDKKWHHGMATLFNPFTEATIRYFEEENSAEARQWLES